MSTPLCSIIMPTRSAPHSSLRKAVESIMAGAKDHETEVEILLRIDWDDMERAQFAQDLLKDHGSYFVGDRGNGYTDMGVFVNDLVKIARGKWCWLFDDDAHVDGPWFSELSRFACDCAVNAQHYCLGPSRYENGARGGCVGLLIPTELAKTIPHTNPVDQQWLEVVINKGWHCNQMMGVTYHHDGRPR